MFANNLSAALLKVLDERNLTQTELAEASNLSDKCINRVIRGKEVPKIATLEQLCTALEITPNDLLLPANFTNTETKAVTKTEKVSLNGIVKFKPVCPHCGRLLESENMFCCNHCSGKLSWQDYYIDSVIHGKSNAENINKRKK